MAQALYLVSTYHSQDLKITKGSANQAGCLQLTLSMTPMAPPSSPKHEMRRSDAVLDINGLLTKHGKSINRLSGDLPPINRHGMPTLRRAETSLCRTIPDYDRLDEATAHRASIMFQLFGNPDAVHQYLHSVTGCSRTRRLVWKGVKLKPLSRQLFTITIDSTNFPCPMYGQDDVAAHLCIVKTEESIRLIDLDEDIKEYLKDIADRVDYIYDTHNRILTVTVSGFSIDTNIPIHFILHKLLKDPRSRFRWAPVMSKEYTQAELLGFPGVTNLGTKEADLTSIGPIYKFYIDYITTIPCPS